MTDQPQYLFVDVGCADVGEGQPRWRAFTEKYPGSARITAIDGSQEAINDLSRRRNLGEKWLDTVVLTHAVVGADNKAATLHVTRFAGCTSLLKPDPDQVDRYVGLDASDPRGNFYVIEERRVEPCSLDSVLRGWHGRDGHDDWIDWLKLDVQGIEHEILSAERHHVLARCAVVEVELNFVQLYKKQGRAGQVIALMEASGFSLHKMLDIRAVAPRPWRGKGGSQWGWANAVFVRDIDTDGWTPVRALRAAMVLHTMYESPDVGQALVAHHCAARRRDLMIAYEKMLDSAPMVPTALSIDVPDDVTDMVEAPTGDPPDADGSGAGADTGGGAKAPMAAAPDNPSSDDTNSSFF